MSPNALQKLRDWLTTDEAARELSAAMGETVSAAEILRLAIDGHLKLSLYLPARVTAICRRLGEDDLDPPKRREVIEGLWDLPMLGRVKLQIEHEYHWARGLYVPMDGPVGALVEQGEVICQLPADRGESGMWPRSASEFPRGSVLAVRRTALEEFIETHAHDTATRKPGATEKPLGERERATLLTIIAALAGAADIDISKPSKAAESIETLTTDLGARVSARSIENHLKRIPDAIERKGKTAT